MSEGGGGKQGVNADKDKDSAKVIYNNNYLDSCEKIVLKDNAKWESLKCNLPIKMANPDLFAYKNDVFVVGG